MAEELTVAIQGFKLLWDKIKTIKEVSNSIEIVTAVTEIQQKLLDSQEKQAALADKVRNLEAKLREVEDWKSQMQRYELFEFPETKALAHKLKPEMANGEPIHYLCRTCVEKNKKTTLQPQHRFLHCPECKSEIETKPQPPYRRHSPSGGSQSWMS